MLTHAQIEQLHDAALRILEQDGIGIDDEGIRDLLQKNGCEIREKRVFFSRGLVDAAIAKAQSHIPFKSKLSGKGFVLEPGVVRTHSTGGAPWAVDIATGQRRNANTGDLVDSLRLMNQLNHLDLPCGLFYPEEMPAPLSQYLQTENMFRYCHKPIYAPGVSTLGNAKYIAELFKIFDPGDGKYAGMIGISPESPLYLPQEITDVMQVMIKAGVPVGILSAPMAGLTGPITLGGCVAQCHAEVLAFASLAFLIRAETPLIFSYRPFFCNMKVAQAILGLPENGMASAICAQLATYCGFHSDVYGLSCTAYDYDEQTGYEKMFNSLTPALAGASLITGFGSLASVMCGSLPQLVMDNEMFGMVRRACQGVALDDESLGMEAIESVALEGSTFLTEMHTMMNLRAPDIFTPKLGFDKMLSNDTAAEASLLEKATQQVASLLAKDEVIPWSAEVESEVTKIRKAAETELL